MVLVVLLLYRSFFHVDVFLFQAEEGIRFLVQSSGGIHVFCLPRGLDNVYKRHTLESIVGKQADCIRDHRAAGEAKANLVVGLRLLHTSDAADDLLCVALGGRRLLKEKNAGRRIILNTIGNNTT